MASYRDQDAWQASMEFGVDVYKLTRKYPRSEMQGLTQQTRRAVISISSNIAEGQGRGGAQQFLQFLRIAKGSLCELETQLIYAVRLDYVTRDDLKPIWESAQRVGKLLNGLIRALERKTANARISASRRAKGHRARVTRYGAKDTSADSNSDDAQRTGQSE